MPAVDLDALTTTELRELCDHRAQLVTGLTRSLDNLRSHGAGLSQNLQHEIRRYQQRHRDFENQLATDPDLQTSTQLASLDDWEACLRNGTRRRTLANLFQDVLHLEIRGAERPGPLARVWDEVDRVRNEIAAGHASLADELLEGRHLLNSLLTLVRRGDELPDDIWTDWQDQVASRYGRELSTAISRGRVVFRDASIGEVIESIDHCQRQTEVPA